MKIYVPDYYDKFKCTADKCRHSCCIGWEIDIDSDTLTYYRTVGGEIGCRLRSVISDKGGTAHFILDNSGRCPMLEKSGLCSVISTLGENSLCQICTDHPRWRGFYGERTEMGIGMCCEAAAEIILTHREKTSFVLLSENDEPEYFDEVEKNIFLRRECLVDILQDRTVPLSERIDKALAECGAVFPKKQYPNGRKYFYRLNILTAHGQTVLTKSVF